MNRFVTTSLFSLFGCLIGFAATAEHASAQAGLRESLELLDRDNDGYIDPDEITPLARPYLERIAEVRRISLSRPYRIDRWQEAARIYFATKNGARDERIRTDRERTLKTFRPDDEDPVVPEFGLPEVKYQYTYDDLDEADDQLRRYDRNRDGYLDRDESARARWSRTDPFMMDFNKDDRLSRLELAQRYARRRMIRDDSGELIQRIQRVGNGIRPSVGGDDRDDDRRRRNWYRRGGNRYWLTASVMERFDDNDNGRLEPAETVDIGLPAGAIDADQDGELSREELFAYFKQLQDQTGGVVEGLPGWFYELDANRDQQIDLPEFTAEGLTDAKVDQFVAMDTNQDGLLAPLEVLSSKAMTGGRFENTQAEILPPQKTIVSEIEIEEGFRILDLNVQLNLTHTNVSDLDGYLTGPDGTRVELFTAVGGRENNFDDTIFDDQASTPITKSRPPFDGSFQPEALVKRQPGLSEFNGKSIQGVWQLTIRGSRSERFGMLHNWALIVTPDEESLLNPTPAEENAEETEREKDPEGESELAATEER
jgi:subtilisin-like proprotein convertase family protein/Ca2+-binding EF-hand superfamily protein